MKKQKHPVFLDLDCFVALVGGALVNVLIGFRIPEYYVYVLCSAVALGQAAIQLTKAEFGNSIPSVLDVVLFQTTCALFLHLAYFYLASVFPFIDRYFLYFTDIPASYLWLNFTNIYNYATSATEINFVHISSKTIVLNLMIRFVFSSNNLGLFDLLVNCGKLYTFIHFSLRYSR